MSDCFGPAAAALAGHAARALGWRPAEFWAATPAELGVALAPPDATGAPAIDRQALQRMIEKDSDDGRPG